MQKVIVLHSVHVRVREVEPVQREVGDGKGGRLGFDRGKIWVVLCEGCSQFDEFAVDDAEDSQGWNQTQYCVRIMRDNGAMKHDFM